MARLTRQRQEGRVLRSTAPLLRLVVVATITGFFAPCSGAGATDNHIWEGVDNDHGLMSDKGGDDAPAGRGLGDVREDQLARAGGGNYARKTDRWLAEGVEEETIRLEEEKTFFGLAMKRFVTREGRAPTLEEEEWTFKGLQLVRVPKAASTAVSVTARNLAGCMPHGPCCRFPGDPVGTCPAKGLMCPKVTGCTGHHLSPDKVAKMQDPGFFSMSNLRDVADRIVSAFFYTPPHSPSCARAEKVDYESCFLEMVHTNKFQNVAARMFAGHYAYDAQTTLCLEDGPGCDATLASVIQSACNLNFVALCEAWSTSMLLLFETIPFKAPRMSYFPAPKHEDHHTRRLYSYADLGPDEYIPQEWSDPDMNFEVEADFDADLPDMPEGSLRTENHRALLGNVGNVGVDATRHNTGKRHEEGIGHITREMMDLVRRENAVDVELHAFVTAKFCDRLRQLDLLNHSVVVEELGAFQALSDRCYDKGWVQATLSRFEKMLPGGTQCRLYEPLSRDWFV